MTPLKPKSFMQDVHVQLKMRIWRSVCTHKRLYREKKNQLGLKVPLDSHFVQRVNCNLEEFHVLFSENMSTGNTFFIKETIFQPRLERKKHFYFIPLFWMINIPVSKLVVLECLITKQKCKLSLKKLIGRLFSMVLENKI